MEKPFSLYLLGSNRTLTTDTKECILKEFLRKKIVSLLSLNKAVLGQ